MGTYRGIIGQLVGFERQFEDDGDGAYVYRLRGKGRPIRVSREERGRFVSQYGWRVLAIEVAMWAALLTFFFKFYWRIVLTSKVLPSKVIFSDPFFYAGMVLIVLPAATLLYWVAEAPARALSDRPGLGPEPTRDEKRAIGFRQFGYGQLALVAMIGAASYKYLADGDWDRHWIFMPPLVVSVAAMQAFRKWRFERRHPELMGQS
jgi:hypothetical protein